jgi:hypothetical protein
VSVRALIGVFPLSPMPPPYLHGSNSYPPLSLVIFMCSVMIIGLVVSIGMVSWVLFQVLQSANETKSQPVGESEKSAKNKEGIVHG